MTERWGTEFELVDGTTGRGDGGISLAGRAREIRVDLYGQEGVAELAAAVGVPPGTWLNFEAGIAMPSVIVLRFLDVTRANPRWLLDGRGDRYVRGGYDPGSSRLN